MLGVGTLSLAMPGLVIGVGTLLARQAVGVGGDGDLPAVAALVARLLTFALLPVWLALREVPAGLEDAAAVLGAGRAERAVRVWGPLASKGMATGFLLVFLLGLRELDAVVLVQPQVFPLRLHDKIHYSRMADEANLAILYVGHLLVPAILLAVLWGSRRRKATGPAERSQG